MSLRTLIRLLALALACLLLVVPLWDVAGPVLLMFGPGLLLLTLGYLTLTKGGAALSRWQLRYHLPEGKDGEGNLPGLDWNRLEDILDYLAARSGHLVLEGSADGLYLELPAAFDRYVEAQLPGALPELRLLRDSSPAANDDIGRASYLSVGSPSSQALRWATEESGRQVRVHIHAGPHVTLVARTDGSRPPGRWLRIPVPRPLNGFWHRLPVWDELSAGVALHRLFPPTGEGAVYSSRSRLLGLKPPDGYRAAHGGRKLGHSVDGRPVTLDRAHPLLSVGAPPSFLLDQIADDLAHGGLTIVLSPDRRFLDMARHELGGTALVQRLDPQNSQASIRLALVPAGEWDKYSTEVVVRLAQTFLRDVGFDVDLPAVQRFSQHLLQVLDGSARQARRDLAFTDLYAVSQSSQALQAFLEDVQRVSDDPTTERHVRELLQQMSGDEGYVQAVTILSALRTALAPLRSGPLHTLSQGPYFGLNGTSPEAARLLLVPMTNHDFPQHDRLLGAMLDLTLERVLSHARQDLHLALHLHDPHLYREDGGQRWLDAARQDARLSLLLNVQDPAAYASPGCARGGQVSDHGELFFRFSQSLAATLIADWNLPATASEFQELPPGIAIARLGDMVVALKAQEQP